MRGNDPAVDKVVSAEKDGVGQQGNRAGFDQLLVVNTVAVVPRIGCLVYGLCDLHTTYIVRKQGWC